MRKILGVAIIGLALAVVITPQFLNCSAHGYMMKLANGGTTPMVCFWSARAEIAVGIPIFVIGLIMTFSRTKESLRYLGILGIALGVFVMLIPTVLIGVCNDNMVCTTVMKPSLLTFGSIIIGASLIGVMLSWGKENK